LSDLCLYLGWAVVNATSSCIFDIALGRENSMRFQTIDLWGELVVIVFGSCLDSRCLSHSLLEITFQAIFAVSMLISLLNPM
jgi:hypothetical protein